MRCCVECTNKHPRVCDVFYKLQHLVWPSLYVPCVCQWATCMALACWMPRAWWRRLSAGKKFPRSTSVWRPPSSRAGTTLARDPCFESGFPFILPLSITLYLFLSRFSRRFLSHSFSHTLMGVVLFSAPCFLPPLSSLLLTVFSLPHDRTIHPGSALTSVYESAGCSGEPRRHVVYAEHVVVRATITHSRRGDLSITLTSPSGTVSQLLANR